MRMRWGIGMAAVGLLLAVAPAVAQPVTCSVGVTPMMFGGYVGNRSAPLDITASVTVTCINAGQAPAKVAFSVVPVDGVAGERVLRASSGGLLVYRLFADPAHTVVWVAAAPIMGGGMVMPGAPLRQNLTIYGRVLGRQWRAVVGQYLGSVPVLVTW